MSPRKASFAIVAVASILLSGCASQSSVSPATTHALTRHVSINVTDLSNAPTSIDGAMAKYGHTFFEYTHSGATLDVAGTTVRYQAVGGLQHTTPLSAFTTQTQLHAGDVVKIDPVDPAMDVLSGMTVERAGQQVSVRSGNDRAWLKSEGYPIPVATAHPGLASWSIHTGGGVDLHLHDLSVMADGPTYCDASGCHRSSTTTTVQSFDLNLTNTLDATVQAKTTAPASGTELTYALPSLTDHAKFDLGVRASVGNDSRDIGLAGDVQANLGGHVTLSFDGSRQINKAAVAGSVAFDGTFSSHGLPPGSELPPTISFSRDLPEHTETVAAGRQPDAAILSFVQRLWAMDLIPGDEFHLAIGSPFGSVTYASQVLAIEPRTVGTETRSTLRMADHMTAHWMFNPEGFSFDFTYWLDAASYLPVYEQGTMTQTFRLADYPQVQTALTAALGSAGAHIVHYPNDAVVSLRSEATLQLTSYSGDYSHAAVLGLGATLMPATAVFLGAAFVAANNLGRF
ncbi:MAG: hypothetical protein V4510_01695 [bacterium]